MPHALLLSPDDQAVNAITGVLEEMSVTCERPLDGVSAAKKLNSQNFDLVLVDCENLPAAKLIFDVCRRGKNGNNPVPIAIVDGRAGLPTAFRLGAELILTKPVAKDQARSTIRTAVSRVRKDVPVGDAPAAKPSTETAPLAAIAATGPSAVAPAIPEDLAQAAAVSSQTAGVSRPALSSIPSVPVANLDAPAPATLMTSALEEIETAPASPELIPQAASLPLPSSSDLGDYSSTGLVSSDADFKNSAVASVEPLIAESKQTEAEASQPEKSTPEVSEPSRAVPEPGAATPSEGGLLASDQPTERKTRGPLVALLLLVLVAGGFYAAWTYQPGFQDVVQSQINHLLALVGMAPLSTPPPPPAKPLAHIIPAPAPAPAPLSPADPSKIQSTVSDSATGSATSSAAGSATVPPATGIPAPTPSQSPTPATKAVPPASGSKAPLPSSDSKQEPGKASDGSKDQAPPAPSNAPLAEENSAIILSSKGAEKRLAYSFAPKYPAEAHAEGTIVLKEVVDANGKVEGIRLIEGDAALASIAIQAVKQWRYRPFVRDGKALPFQTVVIIDFQHP